MALHSAQKFTPRTVRRPEILKAPYNPRKITDAARKRLKASLSGPGLVMPLVWNARSGRLVGGHQRLSVLDQLAGGEDYELTVAAVDLDDAAERELCVFLNNPAAQGDWDVARLGALFKEGTDPGRAGFDYGEVMQMFGELPSVSDAAELAELSAQFDPKVKGLVETLNRIAAADDANFYLCVVCRDYAARKALTDLLGLPDNRYVDVRRLVAAVAANAARLRDAGFWPEDD